MKKPKDPYVFVGHIFDSIENINDFIKATNSLDDFTEDVKTQSAVLKMLEIIGEATKNISPEFKNLHPEIIWSDPAGLRDVLIHDYFDVDLEKIWNIVKNDLPEFEIKIKKLLDSEPQ